MYIVYAVCNLEILQFLDRFFHDACKRQNRIYDYVLIKFIEHLNSSDFSSQHTDCAR